MQCCIFPAFILKVMKNIFLLLFLLCSNLLVSQQITFNVQSNFGYKYLKLTNILPTDSCYYVNGVITDTTNQQYNFGSLFVKFNLEGDTISTKKLVVPNTDYLTWNTGLFATSDANLATAGETPNKIFFLKYTKDGDTLSIKEYVNPNFPLESFITANDLNQYENGYYLSGIYLLSADIAPPNIVVLKLDEDGDIIQVMTYGNNSTEFIGSTIVEADEGLIIGGSKSNIATQSKNFVSRTYIFKVDSLGTIEWEYQSPSGQLWDMANSMVKTSDGGLVVASGKGIEHVVNPEVSLLLWQGYIFKLNANHQLIWGRELRGTRHAGSPSFAKIVRATDGAGYVAYGRVGETVSTGSEVYGSWVVKVSNQGDSLWARYYSLFDDHLRQPTPIDFKVTPDGGYIVCGNTQEGQQTWGWLMKLDSFGCLIPGCNANDGPNAATEEAPSIRLTIYPNPTSDFLNFELRTPQLLQQASFRIFDSNGRVMKEVVSNSPKDTFIVPVREWAAGTYFLQYMEAGEVRAVEKFIVTRK
jgi:hypothetical protein